MANQQDETHLKIGIMGCGAIGSGIADAVYHGLHPRAKLSGVYDIAPEKSESLCQKLENQSLCSPSLKNLIQNADLVVETVSSDITEKLIRQIIENKKHVLVMSIGKLLTHPELFDLARTVGVNILIPSGAVAGIDALKAVNNASIYELTLTTYKPPKGLQGAPYIKEQNISLQDITQETIIFDGTVDEAVAAFPQNINVAATIALAAETKDKLRVRIITSPELKHNRHEICIKGDFGEITTISKNLPCPSNPKTSYLAVLSGIAALKTFCDCIKIGT